MKDLNYFRNKIRNMNFIPMTDDELKIVIERNKSAVNNARLEGIYETQNEKEFFQMLIDERVPADIRKSIVKEWAISSIYER